MTRDENKHDLTPPCPPPRLLLGGLALKKNCPPPGGAHLSTISRAVTRGATSQEGDVVHLLVTSFPWAADRPQASSEDNPCIQYRVSV